MHDLKVIFMGTPDFSVPALEYLISNTNVVLVVTQPDKEIGRKHEMSFSPVKKCALKHNIDVFQPNRIRNDYEIISEINPDIIITCAYGQIVPKEILEVPKYGCINIHASLLPKYRGAAPIQWSILNGEKETGITLMFMDEKMDTGDIIAQEKCNIEADDNVGTLHDKLSLLGTKLLSEQLENIVSQNIDRKKQDSEQASYAPMIKRSDEHINFANKGTFIINQIRALNPWPLANININDKEIKIIEAFFEQKNNTVPGKITITKKELLIDCIDGIISIKKVKPMGKKEMTIESFINGLNKESIDYAK